MIMGQIWPSFEKKLQNTEKNKKTNEKQNRTEHHPVDTKFK